MAERRMFTKKVTDDDNFVMLSSSAQALYFHLSMQADDDGFCNQVNASMFKAHASVEDLKSLLERRYIYQFDDGVIVIKHWRMANALRRDRYTPTSFQEDFARLDVKENGSYTLKDAGPSGCQMVAACLPQDRLGKDSIGKDSISTSVISDDPKSDYTRAYADEFEMLWTLYPRKQGDKRRAYRSYLDSRKHGTTFEEVKKGINDYIAYIKANNKQDYIAHGSTWFNQKRWNNDYTITKKPTTKDIAPAYDFSDF